MTEFEEKLLKEIKRLNTNLEEISISLQYVAEIDIDDKGNVRGK
ncbi:hypothetical protein OGZ51_07425 [Lactococcus lactis]|uniref:Uncharacterized protein n=1 Tax=Lactococcus lactis TaxID=1358 RepID=A0A9X4NHS7_9LACT|nr:hypothetical protein [Lactococcus lactis]MDG4983972.1 hypothetical protein [Lactococcus lactis]